MWTQEVQDHEETSPLIIIDYINHPTKTLVFTGNTFNKQSFDFQGVIFLPNRSGYAESRLKHQCEEVLGTNPNYAIFIFHKCWAEYILGDYFLFVNVEHIPQLGMNTINIFETTTLRTDSHSLHTLMMFKKCLLQTLNFAIFKVCCINPSLGPSAFKSFGANSLQSHVANSTSFRLKW